MLSDDVGGVVFLKMLFDIDDSVNSSFIEHAQKLGIQFASSSVLRKELCGGDRNGDSIVGGSVADVVEEEFLDCNRNTKIGV